MGRRKVLLTAAEYARHRKAEGLPGGTRAAVYNAIKSGRIVRDERKKIHADDADRMWAENTGRDGGQAAKHAAATERRLDETGAPRDADGAESKSAAGARKLSAEADIKEMDRAEREGSLVNAKAEGRRAFAVARLVRDRALAPCRTRTRPSSPR